MLHPLAEQGQAQRVTPGQLQSQRVPPGGRLPPSELWCLGTESPRPRSGVTQCYIRPRLLGWQPRGQGKAQRGPVPGVWVAGPAVSPLPGARVDTCTHVSRLLVFPITFQSKSLNYRMLI